MNPFALTAEERAGAMMEPATKPDVGAFMDNIGALRAMVGPRQRYGNGAWLDESTAGTVTVGEGGAGVIRRARSYIAEESGKTYGAILPLKKDDATGDLSLAIPGFARDSATGILDMLEGHMTPEASMALLDIPIGGLLHAGVTGARQTPETLAAIRAYHGSPHRFDRFDMGKIGTGEGAQAYGHGLYMAESPDVARQYRDNVSALSQHRKILKDNADFVPSTPVETLARNAARDSGGHADRLAEWFSDARASLERTPQYAPYSLDDLNEAERIAKALDVDRKGALYTTRLDVEPEDLLDWDAPLSEQSAKVRAAVAGRIEQLRKVAPDYVPDDPDGAWIYKAMGPQGGVDEIDFSRASPFAGAASDRLREAGIPGIKYLDQGSPGSGEGTRNFVIFDDKLISIESVD